jgi:hypothetical protein
MSEEEFILKYEELLDKGYCNCNEMNCIDNNSPRRILNICKNLQQELDKKTKILNEFKDWLEVNWRESQDIWYVKIINKLEELEKEI